MKNMIARMAALPLALLLLGASPPDRVVPFPGRGDEALIIPARSPVRFDGFVKDRGEYVGARFTGRFELTGSYTWGCEWDCDGSSPISERENFALLVIPDRALAARLPHWKVHDNDIRLFVSKATPFTHAVTTAQQRAALASGKLPYVKGRIAIIVDHLETSLDCDSASWSADFVATAKPPRLAGVNEDGNFGCG